MTANQVRHWQQKVKREGLPSKMKHVIQAANFDEGGLAQLRRDLVSADPEKMARIGIFGELKDDRFRKVNARMVKSLRASARSLSDGGPLSL